MQPGNLDRIKKGREEFSDQIDMSPMDLLMLFNDSGTGAPGPGSSEFYRKLLEVKLAEYDRDTALQISQSLNEGMSSLRDAVVVLKDVTEIGHKAAKIATYWLVMVTVLGSIGILVQLFCR